MIKTYKKSKARAETTGWEMNFTKHDFVTENTHEKTIKQIISKNVFITTNLKML